MSMVQEGCLVISTLLLWCGLGGKWLRGVGEGEEGVELSTLSHS